MADLEPAESVVAYDVNAPLFWDYTRSQRLIRLPEGANAQYDDTRPFDLPVGTVIAKTLYYPHDMTQPDRGRRLLETRLLIRRSSGWLALPYVWNEEQTDAELAIAGKTLDVSWIHTNGKKRSRRHVVPNVNDCKRCHKNESVQPIGFTARNLNRDFAYAHGTENQLAYMTRIGMLAGTPPREAIPRLPRWDDEQSGTVAQRARAWLEGNCAHCHNPSGPARNSGLYLWASVTTPYRYGVYKTPVAAGRGSGGSTYDIVPGKPDESILVFRLESTTPGVLMPEYGRSLVHEESLALIREWIAGMQTPAGLAAENAIGKFDELSPHQLAEFVRDVQEKADPIHGQDVLRRRRLDCLKCHAVYGVGGHVGPDLGQTSEAKTIAYLIESVLLPNKVIKKGYETVTVVTDAGQAITGIKVRESDNELVLRNLTQDEIRIPRDSIDEQAPAASLMPTNAAAMLSRNDFLDLIAFLAELGKPGAFGPPSAPVVRQWQVLDPVPPDAAGADPDAFIIAAGGRGDLIWETIYSRLSGDLPLDDLPVVPNSQRCFVRCRFETRASAEATLVFDSVAGMKAWLDSQPLALQEKTVVPVEGGAHTLTLMVDREQRTRPVLRCEIHHPALATGQ